MSGFVSICILFAPCTIDFNISIVDGSVCHVAGPGTTKVFNLVLD